MFRALFDDVFTIVRNKSRRAIPSLMALCFVADNVNSLAKLAFAYFEELEAAIKAPEHP